MRKKVVTEHLMDNDYGFKKTADVFVRATLRLVTTASLYRGSIAAPSLNNPRVLKLATFGIASSGSLIIKRNIPLSTTPYIAKMLVGDPVLDYTCFSYGDHELQRVGVWRSAKQQKPANGPWIIYIHGGAWRDPKITHLSFIPTINALISSGRVSSESVAGFASIDYRLSPHPDHPQDPETPGSELRDAHHPDHIRDVQSALKLLKDQYDLSDDYILLGHSAGATLAFQLLMDLAPAAPLPAVIIGISGIYDLVGIDERHSGNYAGFISAAFSGDKKAWKAASPGDFSGSFKKAWSSSRSAVLAWSHEDTLVDEPEIDLMATKLIKDRVDVSVTKELTGEHDQVWEQGTQLAKLVVFGLKLIQRSS